MIDGQNRRIGKKVNGVLVQAWLYQDQLNPVTELGGAGNVVARFVYGSRPNVRDYVVKGGTTYRVLADHLGSPRLVNASTGAVAQRIDYDEWGQVTQDTSPGFQPFGFAGGMDERDTGLVRFGARDYDADSGRWTTQDPLRFDAVGSNDRVMRTYNRSRADTTASSRRGSHSTFGKWQATTIWFASQNRSRREDTSSSRTSRSTTAAIRPGAS